MGKSKKQKQQEEERKRETLRLAIEESRRRWLGKRVLFLGFFNDDDEMREGRFTEVRDDVAVIFVGAIYPWESEDRVTELAVGGEEDLLSVLTGVVVDGTQQS